MKKIKIAIIGDSLDAAITAHYFNSLKKENISVHVFQNQKHNPPKKQSLGDVPINLKKEFFISGKHELLNIIKSLDLYKNVHESKINSDDIALILGNTLKYYNFNPLSFQKKGVFNIIDRIKIYNEKARPSDRVQGDELLSSFIIRKFGENFYLLFFAPIFEAIMGLKPNLLSLNTTLFELKLNDFLYGSLSKELKLKYNSISLKLFSYKDGIYQLKEDILNKLENVHTEEQKVAQIQTVEENKYRLILQDGSQEEYDYVIVANESYDIKAILKPDNFQELINSLNAVSYQEASFIYLYYNHKLLMEKDLIVNAEVDKLFSQSCLNLGKILNMPDDETLLRVKISQSRFVKTTLKDDKEILYNTIQELEHFIPRIQSFNDMCIIKDSQYYPKKNFEAVNIQKNIFTALRKTPSLFIVGSFLRGISQGHTIRHIEKIYNYIYNRTNA